MEKIPEKISDTEESKNKEMIDGIFRYVQDIFKSHYNIKLNAIEQLGLKKICEKAYNLHTTDKRFDCLLEAEDLFLREFFEITHEDVIRMFKTSQERKDYFRIIQEKKNLI